MNIDFILKNYQRHIKPITVVVQENILVTHAKLGDDGYIYPGFCRYKELENKDSYATRMEVSTNPIVIKDQIQGQLVKIYQEK